MVSETTKAIVQSVRALGESMSDPAGSAASGAQSLPREGVDVTGIDRVVEAVVENAEKLRDVGKQP